MRPVRRPRRAPSGPPPRRVAALGVALAAGLAGCAGTPPEGPAPEALLPRISGDLEALRGAAPDERARLQLVATNLVAALVQIPELRPATATLRVNPPRTAYGNALVRALEDAGFGLQVVPADQGPNYVGYSRRTSETETGEVLEYVLSVDRIELSREYVVDGSGAIFPASLMRITGTDHVADIELADGLFREQGADGRSFVSGARALDGGGAANVGAIDVNDYHALPSERRTPREAVLAEARRRTLGETVRSAPPEPWRYVEFRRAVLIFDGPDSDYLGDANKRALRVLARDVDAEDVVVVRACQDIDGSDERAGDRAALVAEELASLGLEPEATWLAPCVRASFRHPSDTSPVPVELVHMRPRAG